MDIQELWQKALKTTKIIRPRVKPLFVDKATVVPYVFLAESEVNRGDSVVRKGEIVIQKPQVVLPYQLPLFEDFDFEKEIGFSSDTVVNFLLVRGVNFPSFKYKSKVDGMEIFNGPLNQALEKYTNDLARREDVHTGLVTGEADCWQFSVLILIADVISKGTSSDIRRLIDDLLKDK